MEIKEFPLNQLYSLITGKEWVDWVYYKFDAKWWESRLYMRIN